MSWQVVEGQRALYTRTHIPPETLQGVSHKVSDRVTVVKHDWLSWAKLRTRGLAVPSPLLYYEFPGRFTPFQHQRETVQHLVEHPKAYCFDGLGLGKSLSALWAADFLRGEGVIDKILVISPLAVCDSVWEPELFKSFPHYRVSRIKGSPQHKKARALADADVYLVNPESVENVTAQMEKVDLVIVDEATYYKNNQARRSRVLKKLLSHVRFTWLLTGTPMPQSPMDAYGLYRLLAEPSQALSAGRWRDKTMFRVSQFKWVAKQGAHETVASYLQPAIWHRKEDCTDLPETPEPIEISVQQTHQQTKIIEQIKENALAHLEDGGSISAVNAAVVLSKIMQVETGGVYAEDSEGEPVVKHIAAPPFFEAVERFVREAGSPVLVLTPYRANANAITKALTKAKYDTALITGDTPYARRRDHIQNATDGKLDALVAVPGTMSHGVDGLQHSMRFMLWAAPTYSVESYQQSIGRLVRTGQLHNVTIGHIITSKLAKSIYDGISSSAELQNMVLEEIRS